MNRALDSGPKNLAANNLLRSSLDGASLNASGCFPPARSLHVTSPLQIGEQSFAHLVRPHTDRTDSETNEDGEDFLLVPILHVGWIALNRLTPANLMARFN